MNPRTKNLFFSGISALLIAVGGISAKNSYDLYRDLSIANKESRIIEESDLREERLYLASLLLSGVSIAGGTIFSLYRIRKYLRN